MIQPRSDRQCRLPEVSSSRFGATSIAYTARWNLMTARKSQPEDRTSALATKRIRSVLVRSRFHDGQAQRVRFGGGFNGSLQHRAQSFGAAFEAQNLSRTLVRFKDDWLSCGVTRRSIAHPQYRGSCKSDASCATAHTRGRLSRVHTARATQSRFGGSPAIHQHWVLIFPSVARSMRQLQGLLAVKEWGYGNTPC
jgi:hypothetical protein